MLHSAVLTASLSTVQFMVQTREGAMGRPDCDRHSGQQSHCPGSGVRVALQCNEGTGAQAGCQDIDPRGDASVQLGACRTFRTRWDKGTQPALPGRWSSRSERAILRLG